MAGLATTHPTLLDLKKSMDPDGKPAKVIDILSERNEILLDAVVVEANAQTHHEVTVAAAEPAVYWRLLNEGVAVSKGSDRQVSFGIGILEKRSEMDIEVYKLYGGDAYRAKEARKAINAMNKEMASTMFYGNAGLVPSEFNGLAVHYDSLTHAGDRQYPDEFIINEGDAAHLTSIWLVNWGPDSIHLTYPKGSTGGLDHRDHGEETATDANSKKMRVLAETFTWRCGLVIEDHRYAVRIANIDYTALVKAAATGPDLIDLMAQAMEKIEDLNGRPAFYCNRTIKSFLRRQIVNKSNVWLSVDQVAGKEVLSFGGVPVRLCEKITNDEDAVA